MNSHDYYSLGSDWESREKAAVTDMDTASGHCILRGITKITLLLAL